MSSFLRSAMHHPSLTWFTFGGALATLAVVYGLPFVWLYAGLAACYGLRFFDPMLASCETRATS
jgi:hypothetical protein